MSKAITEAMKPCPFCGGEPHLMHCGAGTYMIQCLACKATTDDGSQERITANWNRRSAISAAQAQPVAIKPLNWQHDGNASYAYCPVTDVRWAARNQAERAHAEATREARIRSALVPPAVPGEVERENAKLVELIKTRFLGVHPDELDCYLEYDDWTRIIAALSVPFPDIGGGRQGRQPAVLLPVPPARRREGLSAF